ncbi:MAG: N-acetyl-gamma-glutamyl-phosphate reductase [Acidimicrobiaceae bacterium]|nr:N-acetyl-gamma-glutamyl-phosphate reductase [Acidimicrobiaceae bacterium]MYE09755.1 N-acetyl-gamma-glutamyl-phosphate reductase [Acidimicrobiaceae bacterium]MYI35452.1 N-acetyl-gamma-glutamyl-phosphate reductase [Acidimicrobiaceae bacterium]
MHKGAVIGASGFTGAELLRICASHPGLEAVVATGDSMAGRAVADLYPSLAPAYGDTQFVLYEPGVASGCDLAFCALPHGASQSVVPELRNDVKHVVDLAADFRLDDPGLYPTWYGEEHTAPELLDEFVFGLPELFRDDILGAELVAAPGCYVTTATLALAPLVAAGAVEPHGIIVDAASGVSGAGRPPKPNTTFCAVDEDFTAYGLLTHRHTPEIEMAVSRHAGSDVQVLFTPHLAPMNRGILATCYARPTGATSTDEVLGLLSDAYHDEPFVVVSDRSPSTKATLGSNSVHITARADARTGWVMAIAALDNLVKGASGQAVQCANLALGIDETAGLAPAGIYP